jgi:hypothetical protein
LDVEKRALTKVGHHGLLQPLTPTNEDFDDGTEGTVLIFCHHPSDLPRVQADQAPHGIRG